LSGTAWTDTGDYLDGFGNRVTVYAVGNPAKKNRRDPVERAHDKASGYGLLRLDTRVRSITIECWRLMFDAKAPTPQDQFPGWPRTISQFDNDGRAAVAYLPELIVTGSAKPVVQVVEEATGELLYTVRAKTNRFRPKVFSHGRFALTVSDPDLALTASRQGVQSLPPGRRETLEITLEPR